MGRGTGRLAAIVVAAAVTFASCGSGSSGSSAPAATASTVAPTGRPALGPFAVGTMMRTLVDTSRPTAAQGGAPARPSRTLVTTILYPAVGPASPSPAARSNAPPEAAAGPFPLIVFAHGSSAAPADFAALLGSWAAAGYVVAAPAWHAFMQGALDTLGIGDEWYSEPPGLVHRTVSGETAWFLPGT